MRRTAHSKELFTLVNLDGHVSFEGQYVSAEDNLCWRPWRHFSENFMFSEAREGGGASQSCLQLVMTGRRNVIGIIVVLMPSSGGPSINHPPQISDLATTIFLPTDNSMPFDPSLEYRGESLSG